MTLLSWVSSGWENTLPAISLDSYAAHPIADCSAPYRYGKRALEHATSDCQFEFMNCALFHGDHYAGTRLCRVKVEERQNLRYSVSAESQPRAASTLPSPVSTPSTSQEDEGEDSQEILEEEVDDRWELEDNEDDAKEESSQKEEDVKAEVVVDAGRTANSDGLHSLPSRGGNFEGCMIAPTASDNIEEVYQVEMERLPIDSIDLHSCEAKTFVISELVLANQFRIRHLDVIEEIRDIHWREVTLNNGRSTHVIEFARPEQAEDACYEGLYFRDLRLFPSKTRQTERCGRFKAIGHQEQGCLAPFRCGKCASDHATPDYNSSERKCALCGGAHSVRSRHCRAKARLWGKNQSKSLRARQSRAASSLPSPTAISATSQDDQDIIASIT